MKNITAIVVTFLRDEYLYVCVDSLINQYPEINIIIGDQNPSKDKKSHFESLGIKYVELEYDCGLCKARNELLQLVNTDYILIGDDDFKYDKEAKVDEMLEIIKLNDQVDLIGGRILEGGKVKNYQGFIEEYNNHIVYVPLKDANHVSQVDLTFNFFVVRKSAVEKVKWDENIKVCYEHEAFFIDFKRKGLKAYYTPYSVVIHKPFVIEVSKENHKKYGHFRSRKNDKKYFFEKYGIDYFIDFNRNKGVFNKSNIDEIDILITMFERWECLEKLLLSIAKYYPQANIFIADQSKKFIPKMYNDLYFRLFEAGLRVKPKALALKYDCGLSEARNFLFDNTSREYKLLLEEDFVFTDKTDIPAMFEIMEKSPEIGIVGGMVIEGGNEVRFEHYFEKIGRTLYHRQSNGYNDQGFKMTGCVPNFMLMRADLGVRWDDRIKISGEHTDFFLKLAKTDWKVAYTNKSQVNHEKVNDKEYKNMRHRETFMPILFQNHDIDKIVYVNGYTVEFDGEKIITHSK